MGNTQLKFKRKSNKLKVVKRYIKSLTVAPNLEVVRAGIKQAPKEVIAANSNAALNGSQGAGHIPPHLIPLFQRHKHNFDYFVNRRKSIPSKRYLILQKNGALPIVVQLLATVLGSLGENLFRCFYEKMTSSFSKKVVIDQAELDRFQQRQIREHSPELQAMARLLNNMRDIMANKTLTAEERLNSISDMQIRFDKLKKETGVLSGALPARPAPEPPPAAPQMQLKVLAEKGIGPEKEPEEEEEKQYEDILDEKDKSAQASALSPQMARVIRWNIPGVYQQKAHRLLKKITRTSDILTCYENGEVWRWRLWRCNSW